MKHCSRCNNDYPATTEYFQPHKQYRDGLRSQCRKCIKAKEDEYKKNNRDKINRQRVERNNRKPEIIAAREQRAAEKAQQLPYIERRKIARKKWDDKNRDRVRAMRREWKRTHPDHKARIRAKEWAKNNPDRRKMIAARYIAKNPAGVLV